MKMAKRVLSIMMVIITLVSVVSISAEALSVIVLDRDYGYMVPVNYNGKEVISTVKLYGSYDYINFYIKSESYNNSFFYEIYSDKKLTKCVQSGGFDIEDSGAYYKSVKLKLKGNYSSKTYYVITYAAYYHEAQDELYISSDSICTFKLSVDRTTSFSKQKVMLKEVKNSTKGATISWSKLSGASKYYIYRRSITGSKWTKVGSVSSSKTSFTDTSIKSKNGNYIYTVKAVNKKGTVSRYHYAGLTCLFAKAPTLSSVEVRYDNTIEIKWKKTTSADADYLVYRKADGGSWKKIANCGDGTWFKDTTAKNGVKYSYSVKAVIPTKYGKATSGYYYNSDKAVTYLEAPCVEDAVVAENGIGIKWSLGEGAVGYYVYRKPLNGSTGWKTIGEVGAEVDYYVDTTASITDGKYLYSVRSKAEENKGSYDYAGVAYVNLKAPEYRIDKRADGYYLWCEEVPDANVYYIYPKDEDGEWGYGREVWAGNSSAKLEFPTPGTREFTVVAARKHYSKTLKKSRYVFGDFDANAFSWTDYPDINLTTKLFSDKIEIGWQNTNAQGYNVYKKETLDEGAQLQLIASVGEGVTQYTDTDVQTNVQYTYVVRGVFDGVEQTEGDNPCTVEIYPKDTITEKVNVYVVENSRSSRNGIKVAGDIENAYFYKYNESKDTWENFAVHCYYDSFGGDEYTGTDNLGSSNKIKVGVSFLRENGRTAIDDYVVEIERYQPQTTITQTCTKTGVKMTLTPDAEAIKYCVETRYDLSDEDLYFDVADGKAVTHTFKTTEMDDDETGTKYGHIRVYAKRGSDGSRNGEMFVLRFVAAPKLVDAKKNSDGYPVVKWANTNINSESTMHIYRKAPNGDWECVKSLETSDLKTKKFSGYNSYNYYFVDKTAESGVKYTYSVQQEVTVRKVATKSYLDKTGVTTN